MKRKFYDILARWDKSEDKMPLMVVGARQVGKTYIINKYCKDNYKNYCYINLFDDNRIIKYFDGLDTFSKKLEMLEETYNIHLKDKDTILFVDEVQESEKFIESLKLFCEEGYTNIICAGSLLGVKLKRFKASYPVGKVYEEKMYPMDFEEYLWAVGKERYIKYIEKSFVDNSECIYHNELMEEFNRFLFLGGMPKIIQDYIDNDQKLSEINKSLITNIINSYVLDMKKYTDDKENIRIERIYNDIPSQLAKENQKFVFAKLDKQDNRKRDYITSIDWLVSSLLVLPCYNVTNPKYPLKVYLDYGAYKLFLNDTGILCNLAGISSIDVLMNNDLDYKGVLVENYVATELLKMEFDLSYWSRRDKTSGSSEVDFIIQGNSRIIPIEVKAGTDMKSKSLEIYNAKYKPSLIIKISAKNFGQKDNLKTIPLYATFCLKKLKES